MTSEYCYSVVRHKGQEIDTAGFLSGFCPSGVGQNEIVLGGKYTFVCKACGNLGGSGGMLPQEI